MAFVGSGTRVARLTHLEALFPALSADQYEKSSEQTDHYNCLAYAANDEGNWWGGGPNDYWPHGVPYGRSAEDLIAAYATRGYSECSHGRLEVRYEKIAIYVHPDTKKANHAAKQLPFGRWTSKLGELEDIEHATLAQLESGAHLETYGFAVRFVRRRRNLVTWLSHCIRYLSEKSKKR